jgi:kinetochore protein Mis13/DSN1
VSEASFYKHIDADLPEVERIRQLLIWCAMRAAPNYNKPPSPPSNPLSSSSSTNHASSSTKPPPDPLPPLSAKAQAILKKSQDQFVKMLAEKQIDLSVQGPVMDVQTGDLKENEQNVRNRHLEGTYSTDIQRCA